MELDEVFTLYRDEFLPAYADVVGYVANKPEQIANEIENIFSHIAQIHNPNLSVSIREANVAKSYDHLERVTLDCYKILWGHMNGELEKLYLNKWKRSLCLSINEAEFLTKRREFINKAQEARRLEMTSVGDEPLQSINKYKEVVAIGVELLNSIDSEKENKVGLLIAFATSKEVIITILLSFIAGLMANAVFQLF